MERLGRYVLYDEIGSGGMASVLLGRMRAEAGFSRTVAIKRLHPHLAKDPEFCTMFLDEARLAARIRHPNVVQTLDVVAVAGELFLVMEYVHGEPLAQLEKAAAARGERIPPAIAASIVCGLLLGLDAAHEATSETGEPLDLVHRDVSPQNVLVGIDGIARVLDFGVAKALGRLHTTREGQVKGKLAYMAPEQIRGGRLSRRTDVFAAAAVLWGALVGRKLFAAANEGELLFDVLEAPIEPPSRYAADLPPALDAVVLRGLARDPRERFASAREMAVAIEEALPVRPQREVGEWVERMAGARLAERMRRIADIERGTTGIASPGQSASDSNDAASISDVSTLSLSRVRSGEAERRSRRRALLVAAALGAAGTFALVRVFGQAPAPASHREVDARQAPSETQASANATEMASASAAEARPIEDAVGSASAAARPAPSPSASVKAARPSPPRPTASAAETPLYGRK